MATAGRITILPITMATAITTAAAWEVTVVAAMGVVLVAALAASKNHPQDDV